MTDTEIIQALKDNKTVYILLSKSVKDFIGRTPLKNFICLQDEQAQIGKVVWGNPCTDEFFNDNQDETAQTVLRLRPDYEDKPVVLEVKMCEIKKIKEICEELLDIA